MTPSDQDIEIGRLIREHGDRRKEYIALSAKIKRIASPLQMASGALMGVDAGEYPANSARAKALLEGIASEIDLAALLSLVDEHVQLTERLKQDQETLRRYGVEK